MKPKKLKVVSLFCGCGGLDMGFAKAGFDIVWSNDLDKFAVQTYNENFEHKALCCDINDVDLNTIPIHDVLIGGFPCQPFSMMGKEMGFEDRRGMLFFRFIDIIENQKERGNTPKVIVLENVRRLMTHDNGNTFKKIKETLNDAGYTVIPQLINSADFGVPQTRRRYFLVCFADEKNAEKYCQPQPVELDLTLQDLLEHNVDDKYFLSEKIKKTILSTGSGNYYSKPVTDLEIARPLTATMAKMHRASQDNYVTQKKKLRRLTPRECARLQGFSDDFKIPVSDCQAYKQFGNAVTVNVSEAIAESVLKVLGEDDEK